MTEQSMSADTDPNSLSKAVSVKALPDYCVWLKR